MTAAGQDGVQGDLAQLSLSPKDRDDQQRQSAHESDPAEADATPAASKKKRNRKRGARKKGGAAAGESGGATPGPTTTPAGVATGADATDDVWPPTRPLASLPAYRSGHFPVGELLDYADTGRRTRPELIMREDTQQQIYEDLREAAEVHRQVRRHAQRVIKPGMSMIEICQIIEVRPAVSSAVRARVPHQ